MHALFVFLDGVGLGTDEAARNPYAAQALPAFEALASGQRWTQAARPVRESSRVFVPLDACLGVEGLPQSGTGQAALFTGVNAPRLAGRHYGPFPHSATRAALRAHNVFRRVLDLGLPLAEPVAFANAYPPIFFEQARRRDRWSVTTRACLDAGVRIRSAADVVAGTALTAELTGAAWRERLGLDVPLLDEAQAARQLAGLSRRHAFTLFEYYLTDKVGHAADPAAAAALLAGLDRFFSALLGALDPESSLLVVCSDHGNLEDLATGSHTRNPVPLAARGAGAAHLHGARALTDVVPALVAALRAAWPGAA